MKSIMRMAACVAVVVLTFSVYSCKDDDDEIGNVSDLYGVWEPIHAEGYEITDGEKNSWNREVNAADWYDEYGRIAFYDDGTYSSWYYNNGWKVDIDRNDGCTWQLNGKAIKLNNGEIDGQATIISLSASQLVLEASTKDAGDEYYEKVTYKKVN